MKTIFVAAALAAFSAHAQDAHHDAVDKRGDHVMGFSHEKTAHHFRLFKDGGAIEVEFKDAADTSSRDQIRSHLAHIARMFAGGNFNAPMLIHDRTPPGVPVLQKRKDEIAYRFENTARGARVRITTANAEALAALHEFLRFQISDHRTGDTPEVR